MLVLLVVLGQLGSTRTPVMPEAISVGCASDGGCLTEAQVSKPLLERRSDGLQRCWFASNPKLESAVTFSWRIGTGGDVSELAAREKKLPAALLACFERELTAVPYPKAPAPTLAEATLMLRPAGELEDLPAQGRGPLTDWRLTLSAFAVKDVGDVAAVTRTVRRATATLSACSAHFGGGRAKEPVIANATVLVDRDGKTRRSSVTGDIAFEVRGCLEKRLLELVFPAATVITTATFVVRFDPA